MAQGVASVDPMTLRWTLFDVLHRDLVQRWMAFLGRETLPEKDHDMDVYRIEFPAAFNISSDQREDHRQELYLIIGRHNKGRFDPESGWFMSEVAVVGVNIPYETDVFGVTGTRLTIGLMPISKPVKIFDPDDHKVKNNKAVARDPRHLRNFFEWTERKWNDKHGLLHVHYVGKMITDQNLAPLFLDMTHRENPVPSLVPADRNPKKHRYNVFFGVTATCGRFSRKWPFGPRSAQSYRVVVGVLGEKDPVHQLRDKPKLQVIQGCVFSLYQMYSNREWGIRFNDLLRDIREQPLQPNRVFAPLPFLPLEPKHGDSLLDDERQAIIDRFKDQIFPNLSYRPLPTVNARKVNQLGDPLGGNVYAAASIANLDATEEEQMPWALLGASRSTHHRIVYTTSYMSFFPNAYIRTRGAKDLWVYDFKGWEHKEVPQDHRYQYFILVGDDLNPSPTRAGMRREPRPYFLARNLPERYYLFAVSGVVLGHILYADQSTTRTKLPLLDLNSEGNSAATESTDADAMPHNFLWGNVLMEFGPSNTRNTFFYNCILNNAGHRYIRTPLPPIGVTEVRGLLLAEGYPRGADESDKVESGCRLFVENDWSSALLFHDLDILYNDPVLHYAREFGVQILDYKGWKDQQKWADTVFYEDPRVESKWKRRQTYTTRYYKIRPRESDSDRQGTPGLTRSESKSAAKQFRRLLIKVEEARTSFRKGHITLLPAVRRVRDATQQLENRRGIPGDPYSIHQRDRDLLAKALRGAKGLCEAQTALKINFENMVKAAAAYDTLSQRELNAIERDLREDGTLIKPLFFTEPPGEGEEDAEDDMIEHTGGGPGGGGIGGSGGGGSGKGNKKGPGDAKSFDGPSTSSQQLGAFQGASGKRDDTGQTASGSKQQQQKEQVEDWAAAGGAVGGQVDDSGSDGEFDEYETRYERNLRKATERQREDQTLSNRTKDTKSQTKATEHSDKSDIEEPYIKPKVTDAPKPPPSDKGQGSDERKTGSANKSSSASSTLTKAPTDIVPLEVASRGLNPLSAVVTAVRDNRWIQNIVAIVREYVPWFAILEALTVAVDGILPVNRGLSSHLVVAVVTFLGLQLQHIRRQAAASQVAVIAPRTGGRRSGPRSRALVENRAAAVPSEGLADNGYFMAIYLLTMVLADGWGLNDTAAIMAMFGVLAGMRIRRSLFIFVMGLSVVLALMDGQVDVVFAMILFAVLERFWSGGFHLFLIYYLFRLIFQI